MYIYNISDVRVIDGDTVEGIVDLGFKIKMKENFRLWGINAPEIKGTERAEGLITKEYVINYFSSYSTYTIHVKGKDKYGRWLADFINSKNESLVELLLENNLAVKY